MLCEVLRKVNSMTDEINKSLESVQMEIGELKGVERQYINESSVEAFEMKSDVMCRVEVLEEKLPESRAN